MTVRRVVVDHVLFVVEDLDASRRLFTAALAPLGFGELHVQEDGVHYGPEGLDDFAIYRGSPVTTAAHVAFEAPGREAVAAFFAAALANGATPRGEPGVWTRYSDRYYAAFVNDLHGNNVEAVWHAPEPVADAPRRGGVPLRRRLNREAPRRARRRRSRPRSHPRGGVAPHRSGRTGGRSASGSARRRQRG